MICKLHVIAETPLGARTQRIEEWLGPLQIPVPLALTLTAHDTLLIDGGFAVEILRRHVHTNERGIVTSVTWHARAVVMYNQWGLFHRTLKKAGGWLQAAAPVIYKPEAEKRRRRR